MISESYQNRAILTCNVFAPKNCTSGLYKQKQACI